jgi:D-glycero-D-manno-heptose 1,7-bisphosphate phosphatase
VNDGRVAAFLDRDGTINEEKNFLRDPGELSLIPGAATAIRKLNDSGIATCVISNQSGVARGVLNEDDLVRIHARLKQQLERDAGAHLDRIYYCPHHPTAGIAPYNISCDCRKPGTGMLERGARELDIRLDRSFVVGDRVVDVQAAMAVGATSILVLTGYGATALEECKEEHLSPDCVAPSLSEAVEFILQSIHDDGERTTHE